MTFNLAKKQFTVAPTYYDIVDKYSIRIDLFDSFKARNQYFFTITMYNSSIFDSTGSRVKNLTKFNLNSTSY